MFIMVIYGWVVGEEQQSLSILVIVAAIAGFFTGPQVMPKYFTETVTNTVTSTAVSTTTKTETTTVTLTETFTVTETETVTAVSTETVPAWLYVGTIANFEPITTSEKLHCRLCFRRFRRNN